MNTDNCCEEPELKRMFADCASLATTPKLRRYATPPVSPGSGTDANTSLHVRGQGSARRPLTPRALSKALLFLSNYGKASERTADESKGSTDNERVDLPLTTSSSVDDVLADDFETDEGQTCIEETHGCWTVSNNSGLETPPSDCTGSPQRLVKDWETVLSRFAGLLRTNPDNPLAGFWREQCVYALGHFPAEVLVKMARIYGVTALIQRGLEASKKRQRADECRPLQLRGKDMRKKRVVMELYPSALECASVNSPPIHQTRVHLY